MKKETFLIDLITKFCTNEKYDADELGIMNFAKEAKRLSSLGHLNLKGGLPVPIVWPDEYEEKDQRNNKRDIGTQEYLIGRKQEYLINPITEKSIFIQAGALYLPLLMSDIQIPSFSGILASWADDEDEPESDGDEITISGATFKNKRLYVCLDVPEKLIRQGGPEAEQWLKDCISAALTAKIDQTLGGVAAAGTNKPQGMGYAITTGFDTKSNAIVPSYESIIALEESINEINAPAKNFAFITNPAGRRILRKIITDGGDYLFELGKFNDYPVFVSNLISNIAGADAGGNLLLWGNWKDLAIIQFGAIDIVPDPFTLKKSGKIQLHVNAYFDFKGLRGSKSTAAGNQGTDDNDYAYSFSALAIKEA